MFATAFHFNVMVVVLQESTTNPVGVLGSKLEKRHKLYFFTKQKSSTLNDM